MATFDWMTVSEVATELRVSKMTVYRMLDDGTLASWRYERTIRIWRKDFEKLTRRDTT